MKQRDGSTERRPLGSVMRVLVLPAVLVCAVSAPKAQTSSPVEGGPSEAPASEQNPPPQIDVKAEPAPDGFRVGLFTFKPGGRIKLDIIKDYDAITSEDSFDPRTIVLPAADGGNSRLHARETRLFLDIRGPVGPRARNCGCTSRAISTGVAVCSACATRTAAMVGCWRDRPGPTSWTPTTSPTRSTSSRRWRFPRSGRRSCATPRRLNDNASWAVSVEDNNSSIENPSVPGKAEYPNPDLTTSIRFGGSRGHAYASAFLGKGRYRPTEGDPDNVTLWGSLLSGRLKTFGSDYVYGQFTFGDGVGRYRGGVTAVPDAAGQLRAVGLTAFMGGYEHFWSSRATTNVVYSVAQSEDQDYYADTFNKQLDYAAINFIYWFLPNRAWAGLEYLYGNREVFGGDEASANRLQFAVRFNLP